MTHHKHPEKDAEDDKPCKDKPENPAPSFVDTGGSPPPPPPPSG